VYLFLFELERGRCEVVFEVRGCCGAGNRRCDGRDCKQPGEGDLVGVCAVPGGGCREDLLVYRVVPGAEGAVGDESYLVRLALGEHVVPVAAGEIEAVLHGCDVGDDSGDGELFGCDVGDADVPDLSLALQGVECADRLCVGDGWVGGVELVEIDAIESKPAQRCLAGGAKVAGAAVGRPAGQLAPGRPAAGAGAFVAAFGSDEETVVGKESFGDELL
jgi:hypothetical protein